MKPPSTLEVACKLLSQTGYPYEEGEMGDGDAEHFEDAIYALTSWIPAYQRWCRELNTPVEVSLTEALGAIWRAYRAHADNPDDDGNWNFVTLLRDALEGPNESR